MLNVSDHEYKSWAIQISEYSECCVISGRRRRLFFWAVGSSAVYEEHIYYLPLCIQRVFFAVYFNSYRSHSVGVGGCYYCSYHVGALSAWEKTSIF